MTFVVLRDVWFVDFVEEIEFVESLLLLRMGGKAVGIGILGVKVSIVLGLGPYSDMVHNKYTCIDTLSVDYKQYLILSIEFSARCRKCYRGEGANNLFFFYI